jgi:pilus assembly protein CpaF
MTDLPHINALRDRALPVILEQIPPDRAGTMRRGDIAAEIKILQSDWLNQQGIILNLLDQRDLVTVLVNAVLNLLPQTPRVPQTPPVQHAAPTSDAAGLPTPLSPPHPLPLSPPPVVAAPLPPPPAAPRPLVQQAKEKLQPLLLDRIDTGSAAKMSRADLARDVGDLVVDLLLEHRISLGAADRQELVTQLLDDMLGLGPLEPLLADDTISEIMVNGPKQVYIENKGKLTLTDVQFRDNAHVLAIATRIVTAIGRRIDESSPLVDARLADGSRVNIIIPPLAIDGPTITIRKFSKKKITLDVMHDIGSISPSMMNVLKIAGRCRLNILISGGTGSGKTTLLNAISQMIDTGERVVTIEDAAELQLQQPHVVRLETRPANLEGTGEISMRDLLKNALRMRPDRIIMGECRGAEAIDMLQAMNTGHDGSLSTIHANRPREALTRLENMVGLAGINLAPRAIRTQVSSAIDMIIQVSRMRDGSRRVTHISEVIGMEGDIITMQDLFTLDVGNEDTAPGGKLSCSFKNHGLRPHFLPKAAYYGLDKALLEAVLNDRS